MEIEDLQRRAHDMALGKGWWPYPSDSNGALRLEPNDIAAKLALIHSEVSEALEAVRDGMLVGFTDPESGKPEGLPSELADIVIRVADLAGALRINLNWAVKEKLAYNSTRKHRHGGRAL